VEYTDCFDHRGYGVEFWEWCVSGRCISIDIADTTSHSVKSYSVCPFCPPFTPFPAPLAPALAIQFMTVWALGRYGGDNSLSSPYMKTLVGMGFAAEFVFEFVLLLRKRPVFVLSAVVWLCSKVGGNKRSIGCINIENA